MTLEDIFLNATRDKNPELLYQPIEYILMQGGKRIRPQLVMLGAELFNEDPKKALYIAASFEMLHNFTLIHDDIMDEAPIRRGKETVYKKWNSNIAILSGDALANMALQQILKTDTDDQTKLRIVDLFAQTSLEVCEGQQYDLNFESSSQVTITDYLMMIRLKTAVMLAGCLKSGAIFAKASEEDQQKIYNFGIYLGIAFQLKDDLLDIYADHELFGKMKGMDIQDNKKTYLILRAIEDANEADRKKLEELFSVNQIDFKEKLTEVIRIYEKLSIREKTEAMIESYVGKALEELNAISAEPGKKEKLKEITVQLSKREK